MRPRPPAPVPRGVGRVDPPRGERGLSIVEMMVATLLLAIGVAGATAVFVSASKATLASETRADANRLAESSIEQLRALDPEAVGFDPTSSGFRVRVDGDATVVVPGSRLEPRRVERVDSVDFTVVTDIVWRSVTVGGVTDDESYRLVRIRISWDDSFGAHAVERSSALRPDFGP